MKNYGNKVLHCGVTRTGTTVIRHVFEKLVERFDLDIETVNTGHKLFPKEYTEEQRKEPVLGRVLITRDPFHMLNSMKNTFMNPNFYDDTVYDTEVVMAHLGRVLNQIVEFSNYGIHNDGFVLMLRYESFLPNNLDYLVWFFHNYLKVFSEQKLIPEFEPLTKNQMVEFQKEIVEEFSIKNQLKRIKHLKTYDDMEEKYELHGNHISSKDGRGSIDSLSGFERVLVVEEYSWFLKEFGYMPIQAHSVGFGKKTIKTNCEFASELVCVIPYAYWLHQNNQLEKVITSKGMKSFYYFCDDVEERFDYRTFDMNVNGLNDVPNNWIHHNCEAVTGKTLEELDADTQAELNGVLDYSQWTPPPYKEYFQSEKFDSLKPYVVVNNNYNIEFGNNIAESRRYFNIETLNEIFNHLTEKGYDVIYKRPDNTEFTPDQNEITTLQGGYEFTEITDQGVISDYDLCDYYDEVYNINNMEYENYNEFQMKLFSNAEGFITTNGGGGILCSYFQKPVLFYVPHGKELRPGYLTKENSYIKKLSNANIHVVLDRSDVNDYTELIEKVKTTFTGKRYEY